MKKILSILIFGAVFMSCSKEEKVAVISTQYGDMVLEFYEEVAPMHVESFKALLVVVRGIGLLLFPEHAANVN